MAFDVVEPLYEPSIDYRFGRSTWSWLLWQDGSINYEDQKTYIDLSAELGYELVLIDNWWISRIGREKVEELARYAASKNVGISLWYNSNGYWSDAPQHPKNRMNTSVAVKEMAAKKYRCERNQGRLFRWRQTGDHEVVRRYPGRCQRPWPGGNLPWLHVAEGVGTNVP